jgi:hypothetical protein
MNNQRQVLEAGDENFLPRSSCRSDSPLAHLLTGLERQKEELGPIADELIVLLHRLGVGPVSPMVPPQAKVKP